MKNPFLLEGKNIIITGASSGIGAQCAITCSLLGANIILIARDENRLKGVYGQLERGNHSIFLHDLCDYSKLEEIVDQAMAQTGRISGLIHSAGIQMTLPVKSMKPADYEKLLSVNAISGFELARIASKRKYLDENGASYVFISSTMGILGQAGKVGYCSSKGALISGARALALEFAPKKIRVNCILPAVVETQMSKKLFEELPEESKKSIIGMHPLGLGKPDDVANACVFLLSDASKWITGTNLIVDGGYSAQ